MAIFIGKGVSDKQQGSAGLKRKRNETKFHRLYEFGKALPLLRVKVRADKMQKELSQEKVLATVVSLMERTYIRIGNNEYEKFH